MPPNRGRPHGFRAFGTSGAVAQTAAVVLRPGGAAAPPRLGRTHRQASDAPPFMAELQQKARDAGLWNLGLPELADDEPGTRLSNLEYAPLAEIMGRLFWAPEALQLPGARCAQHDRAAELRHAGAEARWLRPLLEAKTRSAFGMTEPDVASSDATNIATTIVRDGDDYVINGRKWFITGAAHPRCSVSDRDGRDQCGRRPHPPPFLRHRADGCAGRAPGAAAALDGLRRSHRADRRTRPSTTFEFPGRTCSARKAKVSKWRRSGSGRRGFTIACARSVCANC